MSRVKGFSQRSIHSQKTALAEKITRASDDINNLIDQNRKIERTELGKHITSETNNVYILIQSLIRQLEQYRRGSSRRPSCDPSQLDREPLVQRLKEQFQTQYDKKNQELEQWEKDYTSLEQTCRQIEQQKNETIGRLQAEIEQNQNTFSTINSQFQTEVQQHVRRIQDLNNANEQAKGYSATLLQENQQLREQLQQATQGNVSMSHLQEHHNEELQRNNNRLRELEHEVEREKQRTSDLQRENRNLHEEITQLQQKYQNDTYELKNKIENERPTTTVQTVEESTQRIQRLEDEKHRLELLLEQERQEKRQIEQNNETQLNVLNSDLEECRESLRDCLDHVPEQSYIPTQQEMDDATRLDLDENYSSSDQSFAQFITQPESSRPADEENQPSSQNAYGTRRSGRNRRPPRFYDPSNPGQNTFTGS